MIYPKHTPEIIKPLAKDLVFELPNDRNEIYLTFDDGPHPEITPWVMDQLDRFDAKGTFFLVGQNVERYPEIIDELKRRGHAMGNHSYSHPSGWKTGNDQYFADIEKCAALVECGLYRPPYGQITLSQTKALKSRFRIIHWSDLSADFDEKLQPEDCLKYATHNVRAGSIIVFHDSEKAWPRLEKMLPKALEFYQEKGFKMANMA
ncbi:MAG: polysaccharide deacetylase family protein [Flavobacteriales bacterium]